MLSRSLSRLLSVKATTVKAGDGASLHVYHRCCCCCVESSARCCTEVESKNGRGRRACLDQSPSSAVAVSVNCRTESATTCSLMEWPGWGFFVGIAVNLIDDGSATRCHCDAQSSARLTTGCVTLCAS
eukprot:GHVU01129183.1.p1 GENE.GHVU01129183.1~~GHVU01129183.1.p1  ORF type:complete len:128 (-),score=7.76 GHVU01129183.1:342-725(-)